MGQYIHRNKKDAFQKEDALYIIKQETENMALSGEVRIIAVVSSYPGEDIPVTNWTLRVCLPKLK